MKFPLPLFHSRKQSKELNKHDEKVFIEASELAQLRLEQYMADLQSSSFVERKPLSSSQA